MGDAGTRYTLANQPFGVERIWKALERLGRKATGGVPSFENNTALKFWLGSVGGRHELHSNRPTADAYARCLENLGIAVMSESHGLLIDLQRVAQLRDYTNGDAPWNERDDETLAARARLLEQYIVLAEQGSAAAEEVEVTVADADDAQPAPKPKSPGERLAAAIARLRELRAKEQSADGVQTRITEIESSLEALDRELATQRERVVAHDQAITDLGTRKPIAQMLVERARDKVDTLEVQLANARTALEAETKAQMELGEQIAGAEQQRQDSMETLQGTEERYEELLETYEELERQRDGATLSSAEREEMARIEGILKALDSI